MRCLALPLEEDEPQVFVPPGFAPSSPTPMRTLLLLLLAAGLAACDSLADTATTSVRYVVSGPAAVTYTTSSGNGAATTASSWDTEVRVPAGSTVTLTALSANGQPLAASIYVDGRLAKSSHGTSLRLSSSSSSSPSSSGEVEVEGPIEALSATSITVLGIAFSLDGATVFLDDDNNPTTASAFSVGQRVEVKGRGTAGTFRATRIKPDDDGFDDDGGTGTGTHVEVEGAIGAIDAESMTVAGQRFLTPAGTRYLDDRGNPVPRSAFAVGQRAEAEGHRRADGTVVAYKIKQDRD